jgi:3-isopropylmalate dehydratase small subunit
VGKLAADLIGPAGLELARAVELLQDHPSNVYLREDELKAKVNAWVGTLFTPEHIDETAQRAIEAGWDPAALTEQYNAAVAERRSAEAEHRGESTGAGYRPRISGRWSRSWV